MAYCPAFDPLGPYVSNVLAWADCRLLSIGANSLAAFGPESSYGLVWSGVLTIFVALFGYRLLLDGTFVLRDVLMLFLKLGAVLALAGQWPAYRTLVYDVFTVAPAELAAGLLAQPRSFGPAAGLAARIDGVDAAIADLIPPPLPAAVPVPPGQSATTRGGAPSEPKLSEKGQSDIEQAGGLLSISALAGLLSVRMVAGLLLGLGPIFIAFLLFPATQGLFMGWLRGLIGAGLGSIAASISIAMELAIIEPQVMALGDLLGRGGDPGTLPAAIFATSAFFSILMLAVLITMAKVATGLNMPGRAATVNVVEKWHNAVPTGFQSPQPSPSIHRSFSSATPELASRANGVTQALRAIDRRDEQGAADQMRTIRVGATADVSAGRAEVPLPLGQSVRQTSPRKSAIANRRDELR